MRIHGRRVLGRVEPHVLAPYHLAEEVVVGVGVEGGHLQQGDWLEGSLDALNYAQHRDEEGA